MLDQKVDVSTKEKLIEKSSKDLEGNNYSININNESERSSLASQ